MTPPPNAISVIIPTYNRAALLRRGLESALSLAPAPQPCEIVIVDNGSTDSTPEVVNEAQRHSPQHAVRYVREERLGLHNARHAGVWAARGEILVFTDDDATFDREWLRAYAGAFAAHPEMAAAGGPILPVWETPPPQWLVEFLRDPNHLGVFSLMPPEDGLRLSSDRMFFGVNMAIRRDMLIALGGFNPEAFGEAWLGDGETGLVYKLWEQNALIGHVPKALVYHHIPPSRMTAAYLRRRMANQGICDLYSEFHRDPSGGAAVLKRAARLAVTQARAWLRAAFLKDRTDLPALSAQLEAARTQAQWRYMLKIALDKEFQAFVAKNDWLNDLRPPADAARVEHGKRTDAA